MSHYTNVVVVREASTSKIPDEIRKAERKVGEVQKRLNTLREAYAEKINSLTKGGKVNGKLLAERGLLRTEIELAEKEFEDESDWLYCLKREKSNREAEEKWRELELKRINAQNNEEERK